MADLVALGQVGVKILFAVPLGERGNLAVDRDRRLERQLVRLAIHHRQTAGHADADGAGLGVRLGPKLRTTATEQLAVGGKLDVDFEADDGGVGL